MTHQQGKTSSFRSVIITIIYFSDELGPLFLPNPTTEKEQIKKVITWEPVCKEMMLITKLKESTCETSQKENKQWV